MYSKEVFLRGTGEVGSCGQCVAGWLRRCEFVAWFGSTWAIRYLTCELPQDLSGTARGGGWTTEMDASDGGRRR